MGSSERPQKLRRAKAWLRFQASSSSGLSLRPSHHGADALRVARARDAVQRDVAHGQLAEAGFAARLEIDGQGEAVYLAVDGDHALGAGVGLRRRQQAGQHGGDGDERGFPSAGLPILPGLSILQCRPANNSFFPVSCRAKHPSGRTKCFWF